ASFKSTAAGSSTGFCAAEATLAGCVSLALESLGACCACAKTTAVAAQTRKRPILRTTDIVMTRLPPFVIRLGFYASADSNGHCREWISIPQQYHLLTPLAARAAEAVDRLEHAGDEGPLGLGELGAPDVEKEDHAQLGAPVPGLVLHAVVEDDELTLFPGPGLIANPQRASLGHDERQMTDQ